MKKKEKEKAEQQQESSGSEDKRHHRLDSPLPTPQIPVSLSANHAVQGVVSNLRGTAGDRARLQAGGSARAAGQPPAPCRGPCPLVAHQPGRVPGKAEAGKPEDGHTSAPDLAGRGLKEEQEEERRTQELLTWILRLEASFALPTTLMQESLLRKAGEAWAGGISDLCLWKQWQQNFSLFSLPLKVNVWGKKMQM